MPKHSNREAICREVAQLINETRVNRGLSMTALAAKSGLSRAMISFVESGFRNPTLETLLRITEALDIELHDLIREANERAKQ